MIVDGPNFPAQHPALIPSTLLRAVSPSTELRTVSLSNGLSNGTQHWI